MDTPTPPQKDVSFQRSNGDPFLPVVIGIDFVSAGSLVGTLTVEGRASREKVVEEEVDFKNRVTFEHYRFTTNGFEAMGLLFLRKGLPPGRAKDASFFNGPHGVALRYCRKRASFAPSERGGYTVCKIKSPGNPDVMAFALCSLSDNFSYERGREISFGRAARLFELLEQLRGFEKETGLIPEQLEALVGDLECPITPESASLAEMKKKLQEMKKALEA